MTWNPQVYHYVIRNYGNPSTLGNMVWYVFDLQFHWHDLTLIYRHRSILVSSLLVLFDRADAGHPA